MIRNASMLFVLIVAAIFSLASEAQACSCATKPTVLNSFESSDLVVATRLTAVEKTREKEREFDIEYIRSVTMKVIKVYKGDVKVGDELKFAQGGGADCVWTFEENWIGDEFLFYLGKPTKGHPFIQLDEDVQIEPMYRAITCGRSGSIEGSVDDLAYLDKLEKVRGKTRLSGEFGTWFGADEFKRDGIKLKIAGKLKSFNAVTDKKGFFEVYDLPPGEYSVTVDVPFGWKIDDYMLRRTDTGFQEFDPRGERRSKNQIPIRVVKGQHVALDLIFDIDTAIVGRVLSPTGKPMKDVCITAVSTNLKEGDFRGMSRCTDANGDFVIEEMAPGNYILVANESGRLDDKSPFGVVFYPGVKDFKQAGVVLVEAGKYVTGRVIQIPEVVELVTIKGKFLFSDGGPVASETVKFRPDDTTRYDEINAETDREGSFVFRIPKGAVGTIFGDMYTYSGEFKNCERLESLIKASGNGSLTVKSNEVRVDSVEDGSKTIEVSFPFPFCEKAKN